MNKKLKIIGIIIIVLLICWISIFMIDRHQTLNLKKPIFAVSSEKLDYLDSSGTMYRGLGYKIEVKSISDNQMIQTTMYMFNKVVAGAIADVLNSFEEQFKATIVEVYANGNLIVEPNENEEIRKSADKISVNGDSSIEWKVGMEVIVTYTGEIIESYPAQINIIDVQIDNHGTQDLSNKYPEVISELERLYGKEGNFKVIGIKDGEIDQRDYKAYEYFEGARTDDWQGRYFNDAFLLISSDYLEEPIYVANNFYSLKNIENLNNE